MGTPSTSAAIPANRSTSLPPGSTQRTRADETTDARVATAVDHLHRAVTDTIVAQLEANPGPWSCPRHRDGGGLPRNALTRQSYHGINTLSLWIAERGQGFASGRWATYHQWQALGAQVRKGEKGTAILFYKDLPQSSDAETEGPRFVARASFVFNAAQVEGAPDEAAPPRSAGVALTSDLDYFAAQTGALIREGETACYRPGLDEIQMPARHRFISADGYGATLSHELVHNAECRIMPRVQGGRSARRRSPGWRLGIISARRAGAVGRSKAPSTTKERRYDGHEHRAAGRPAARL